MKLRSYRTYLTAIVVIIAAIYILLFSAFVDTPYSSQKIFFLLLIPFLLLINWAIFFFSASFQKDESVIAFITPVVVSDVIYTALSLFLGIILAIVRASIKTQIIMQIVVLGLGVIGFLIALLSASNAGGVKIENTRRAGTKDVRAKFLLTLNTMKAKNFDDERCELLSDLCDEYRHLALSSTPEAEALDNQIAAALDKLINGKIEEADASISLLRFLVKRRSGIRN